MSVIYKIEGRRPLHGQVVAQGLPGAAMAGIAAALLTSQTVTLRNVPHLPALDRLLTELQALGIVADWTHYHEVSIKAAEPTPIPLLTAQQLLPRLPLLVMALTLRCGACRLELQTQEQSGLMPILQLVRQFGGLVEVENGLLRLAFPHKYGVSLDASGLDVQATCSAMLLASLSEGRTELIHLSSDPQVGFMHELLLSMGAAVSAQGDYWTCEHASSLSGANMILPSDPTEVGLFTVAALATGGELTVKGVPATAVTGFISKMRVMGAGYQVGVNQLHFWQPPQASWRALTIEAGTYPGIPPHWIPILLPFLVQAEGETEVVVPGYDLQPVAALLRSLGGEFFFGSQGLKVFGPVRLAAGKMQVRQQAEGLSALIAALSGSGTSEISDMELVEGQFEHLAERLQKLGAKLSRMER